MNTLYLELILYIFRSEYLYKIASCKRKIKKSKNYISSWKYPVTISRIDSLESSISRPIIQ